MSRRGNINPAACESCRRRKVKCNGIRPTCGACERQSAECTYTTQPGITRNAALRSEIEDAKASHSSLLELFWQLKNGDELEVERLVARIKSGAEVLEGSLPRSLEHGDVSGRPAVESGTGTHVQTPRSDQDGEIQARSAVRHSGQTHNSARVWTRDTILPTCAIDPPLTNANARPDVSSLVVAADSQSIPSPLTNRQPNGPIPFTDDKDYNSYLQHSLRTHFAKIQEGFALKCSCISEIFFCHDNIAFDNLFNILLSSKESNIPPPVLCEMCAVAAASGQYVRDMLPPSLIDCWYNAAKHFFDDCIEASLSSATRVSALLGLYNLLNKSTVAIAFFELGLSFASRYLQQQQTSPKSVFSEKILDVIRVQRTINFCNSWLQATLGYIPGNDGFEHLDMASNSPRADEHDFVRDTIANIAILKARTMRTLWACTDVSHLLTSIGLLQEQLHGWYGRLPHQAQLFEPGTDAHIPLKTSIYYVHMLHMGATMLIYRRCLAGLGSVSDGKGLSNEQYRLIDDTLEDGLGAAQQSAKVLYLVRQASQSVRHCWITIFQAYVSGTILLHYMVQSKLSGLPRDRWAGNLDLVDKVLEILNFCQEMDPVAREFATSLSTHNRALRNSSDFPRPTEFSKRRSWQSFTNELKLINLLFTTPPGNTALHQTSHELFDQLCNPYEGRHTMSMQHAEHTSRSTVAFPPTQHSLSGNSKSVLHDINRARTTLTPELSNWEDGYFLDSNEPNWWIAARSSEAYSVGAQNLRVL